MILLDTDHLSVFADERDPRHTRLDARMQAEADETACTIVSVEEIFRGWLAIIHRIRDVHSQLPAYARLRHFIDVLADCNIVPFNGPAADQFTSLRQQRIRVGTMDLRIASIALVNNALLATANIRDFSHVPGLRCVNWLEP